MHLTLPPRQWRIPILFALALIAAAYLRIPTSVRVVIFVAIAIAQAVELWRSLFSSNRPGNVTYWRGVRYETKRQSSLTADDLRAHVIPILVLVSSLLIAGALGFRSIGL